MNGIHLETGICFSRLCGYFRLIKRMIVIIFVFTAFSHISLFKKVKVTKYGRASFFADSDSCFRAFCMENNIIAY